MRVLLISANTEMINMPVLPLGMAFVARATEDAGHEVSQINLMAKPEALNTLTENIQKVQPDIIGLSVRNIDDQVSYQPRFLLEPVKAIVSTCRQNSEAKIVLGGAGYSIFPRHALAYLGADMGIQGEGEGSFVTLLDRLKMMMIYQIFPACIMPTEALPTLRLLSRKSIRIFSLNLASTSLRWNILEMRSSGYRFKPVGVAP